MKLFAYLGLSWSLQERLYMAQHAVRLLRGLLCSLLLTVSTLIPLKAQSSTGWSAGRR